MVKIVEINLNINLDVDDIVDNKDIDAQENNSSSGIFHLQPRHSAGTFYFIVELHINDNPGIPCILLPEEQIVFSI